MLISWVAIPSEESAGSVLKLLMWEKFPAVKESCSPQRSIMVNMELTTIILRSASFTSSSGSFEISALFPVVFISRTRSSSMPSVCSSAYDMITPGSPADLLPDSISMNVRRRYPEISSSRSGSRVQSCGVLPISGMGTVSDTSKTYRSLR